MTKFFDNYYIKGGSHPFPSNRMVLDITEFQDNVFQFPIFIQVYDSNAANPTSYINDFCFE